MYSLSSKLSWIALGFAIGIGVMALGLTYWESLNIWVVIQISSFVIRLWRWISGKCIKQ